ncbi:MAG: aminotransferase class I/II-fold pyridoxal phosphate-dependent enzyme [Sphingobacteriales bacterium]|nr:MAG: aminotransferase class I/II-fold pyridoxal phosphate-dependent enzyme [Sphingobacteriales bacterium]
MSDTLAATLSSYTPASGATNVSLNATLEVRWNERLDPATVSTRSFVLKDVTEDKDAEGRVDISVDRKGLVFVPSQPLKAAHSYRLYASYYQTVYDLAGNAVNYDYWSFTTSSAIDTLAPAVSTSNFPSGSTGLPINSRVVLTFNEPLSKLCVNTQTVNLVKKGETASIPGSVTLASDGRSLTFVASANLSPSTNYELLLNNVCDASGNKLSGVKQGFTTSSSTIPDTTIPTLTSIVPVSGATAVSAQSTITLTFSETIDPTQLGSLQVTASGVSGQIAGSWSISGNIATFTPFTGYPSNTPVNVYIYGIYDLAGNAMSSTSRSFTTGVSVDTIPPQVVMMTPGNGAMDIGPLTPIVLTFSESLRESTVNSTNFMLYVDGKVITPTVYRSADNRTITLSGTLPSAKSVTVIVTSDVTDNAGNKLTDFARTFSTAVINSDTSRPSIVAQSPISGATNIKQLDSIVLYASKPLNSATLVDAVRVAINGVLIGGSVTLDGTNQAITFVPNQPFPDNSLVEVFLTDKLRDLSSNLLTNYRGSFTTGSITGREPNVEPVLRAYYPSNGSVELKNNIVKRAAAYQAVINPDELLITDGALQALYISLAAVCEAGDVIAVESPCVFSVLEVIRVLNLKVIEIPLDPKTGFDVDFFRKACHNNAVKAAVLTPNFHNPTGLTLTDEQKMALLSIAHRYNVALIENDIYGDLNFHGQRPSTIKRFDDSGLVLSYASYAKTLAPGIRLGWLSAGKFMQRAEQIKFALGSTVSPLYQETVNRLLSGSSYERHVRAFRMQLAKNAYFAINLIAANFPEKTSIITPSGGYNIWVKMPDDTDMTYFYDQCEKIGVRFTPGYTFSFSGAFDKNFRVVFADKFSPKRIEAIKLAGQRSR